MKLNRFFILEKHYIVVKGTPEGPTVRVVPSEYLNNLHPDQAIAELKAHIESLQDELGKYTAEDMENPQHLSHRTQLETSAQDCPNLSRSSYKKLKRHGVTWGFDILIKW